MSRKYKFSPYPPTLKLLKNVVSGITNHKSARGAGNKRYVFNVKGNSYRIIALILFVPK
jgi:mRNA-degrading endonuclease HigB of HigAB toxin-antitoxin module